ncbi:hypothetical protein D8I24_3943 (plasmid) [Cupriavidus necator H850]|nr:hypothetical protein D8I24_3943 [Cupriavidus necator H850]
MLNGGAISTTRRKFLAHRWCICGRRPPAAARRQRTTGMAGQSGGSTKMTPKERLAPPLRFRPEMASLNRAR